MSEEKELINKIALRLAVLPSGILTELDRREREAAHNLEIIDAASQELINSQPETTAQLRAELKELTDWLRAEIEGTYHPADLTHDFVEKLRGRLEQIKSIVPLPAPAEGK